MGMSAGHVGLVVGGKAHAKFWPEVMRWTAEKSALVATSPPAVRVTPAAERPPAAARAPKRWNEYEPVWWANRPAYRNETSRPHGDR